MKLNLNLGVRAQEENSWGQRVFSHTGITSRACSGSAEQIVELELDVVKRLET